MTGLLIVADDLSGAAEAAGAVISATSGVADLRLGFEARPGASQGFEVIDTHSRTMPPAEAAKATVQAVCSARPSALVYKKVDSLLRGNIAAETAGLADCGFRMVAALAVPRVGRRVRDGAVFAGGSAVASIPAALGVPSAILSLDVVRSSALADAVSSALEAGIIPVLDSETEADLDRVAAVVAALPTPPLVLGAGGFARSLAPLLGLPMARGRFTDAADRVVAVVGTRAPGASRQVAALVESGVRRVILYPGATPPLDDGDAVVTFDDSRAWEGSAIIHALEALAASIRSLDGRTDLVLTGGDTARRILDAMGVTRLQVELEIEDGAVLSTRDSGAAVVTRPGSFGDDGSLVRIVDRLKGVPV